MDQISDFINKLFKANDWPARWNCGNWSEFHGWLYIISDLAIWAAYFVIPIFLILFLKKKTNIPFPGIFWLFGAFILFCGLTHLMDALIFWWPNYRLSALLRFVTAVISWVTVFAIYRFFPFAVSLKTSEQFEKELLERKKSESKFKGLLESAPDAMVITNKEGKILMVNAQTETIFGYERGELVDMEIEFLIPERFKHHHVHHRQNYAENPKVRSMGVGMDLFGRKKDGSEFPVEVSLSPLKIEGEDLLIMSAIRDTTKQKQVEAEIKKLNDNLEKRISERTRELENALTNEKAIQAEMHQNQLRLSLLTEVSEIFASSPDISKTLSKVSSRITPIIADWCTIGQLEENGALTCMVAVHYEPQKTDSLYKLVNNYPPDPAAPQGIYKVVQTSEPLLLAQINEEFILNFVKDQEHLNLISYIGLQSAIILPLLVRKKVFGILTLALATAERFYNEKDLEFAVELGRRVALAIENAKLYNELQKVNAELELRVAQRTLELEAINKELEAFSYSVSHDLRAPLRSIDGFSNKILKDYSFQFDDQAKDYFARIMNASKKMGILIDDLLKLARLSRIEMNIESVNLSEIATTITKELKDSNPERIASFYIMENMITNGDKNLLQIALQNLMSNAWKYSRNQIHTKIEFGAVRENGQIKYFIRDNGVGFEMKYADKLFGAFQRLHSAAEFEGTGIGLATVQRIIRRHHGNIWAQSEVNKGSTFFFTLN